MKRAQQVSRLLAALLFCGCLALAAPPSSRAQDNQDIQAAQQDVYSNVRVVRLSFVEGDVQFQQGADDWQAAPMNLPVHEGFKVATGSGRAEIEFESGLIIRLADNSELDFTQLALLNGGRITQLNLVQGTIITSASLRPNDALSIIAPNLQVGVMHLTRFRMDTAQGGSWVTVIKGDVEVTSAAGDSRVTIGHMLHISSANPDQVNVDKSPDPDDFDRWAVDRDNTLQQENSQAMQYVGTYSSDFSDYNYGLADLYGYGDFINVAGYGPCWQPYGISAGWMPFWNGRMVFIPGFGWTWISNEPWGWLPFHSGKWVYLAGRGWFWVVTPIGPVQPWNPAPVRWVRAGNQLGWTPLAVGNPRATLAGSFVVTGSGAGLGEIRPVERLHGGPVEILNGAPPAAPAPVARVRQPERGAPGSPAGGSPVRRVNPQVQGAIRLDPTTRTYENDSPPPRSVTAESAKATPQPGNSPPAQPSQPQHSSPPPPAQHSSPPPTPVQHSSPPPPPPPHGSSGGGGGSHSFTSSSGSPHHR